MGDDEQAISWLLNVQRDWIIHLRECADDPDGDPVDRQIAERLEEEVADAV